MSTEPTDLLSDKACGDYINKHLFNESEDIQCVFAGGWQEAARRSAIELRQICKERDDKHATEIKRLRDALKDIANPFKKIQEDAKREGLQINGVITAMLCKDAEWLKQKARAALEGKESLQTLQEEVDKIWQHKSGEGGESTS